MCEQRFGSPLFRHVSHEVPQRNGSNITSSASRTKERRRGEGKLGGAKGVGGDGVRASADALEIKIWEVNSSNRERKGGRQEGRKEGGWKGNSGWGGRYKGKRKAGQSKIYLWITWLRLRHSVLYLFPLSVFLWWSVCLTHFPCLSHSWSRCMNTTHTNAVVLYHRNCSFTPLTDALLLTDHP